MQISLIEVGTIDRGAEPSIHDHSSRLHPGQGAPVTRVEPEDLARFEGEGGLEAPEPAAAHPEEWNANESQNLRSRSP